MNNSSLVKVIVGLSLLTLVLAVARFVKQSAKPAEYTIGILKTVAHPALDLVEQGFVEVLSAQLKNKVGFIYQNADGAILQATHIANNFHANPDIKGMFAIATPAALALYKAEKEKPVFIGAITDPKSLGLLDDSTNICGCSDMIDVKGEIDMLITLLPHAHTIGLIYNPSEPNSRLAADLMIAELHKRHKVVKAIELHNENEIVPTINNACATTDVLLAPLDNMVATTISTISACARKAHKPLIVSDNELVAAGALAARGVDYRDVGREAGKLALEVLIGGKKPADLPIRIVPSQKIHLNKAVFEELKLILPAALESSVVWVE